jgi:hypothetical protein
VSTLHITNGDCAASTLREFLTDPVTITADVLHDGPAPRIDLDAWHALRAKYLEPTDEAAFERTRRELAQWDRMVADTGRHDEIVLWFEHDLFDQLLLIRTLDLLGGRRSVSLICIDRFPGVDRFVGLGQLDAEQLESLVDTRRPVTDDQYALARKAWDAFRAPDPTDLVDMVRQPDSMRALPFLARALKRLLEEYPSTTNGLSRTATAVLREIEAGPRSGHDVFAGTQEREEHPFMGDWGLFDVVKVLADARVPLVTIDPNDRPRDLRRHRIAITDAGRDVLAGRRDAVVLNGIDRWFGGVHLSAAGTGDSSPWRWDAARETLV